MKAVRDRMRKGLTINTGANGKPGIDGAKTFADGRKSFRSMTEVQFAKVYKLKGQVMESTNTGMSVVFATRLQDDIEVVIKVRDRSKSFKREADEREWRATTEVQLNMPLIGTMCQFLEVVETKENYYIVMEKVQGHDLFEQMAKERMKIEDAREVLYQILEALRNMHSAGRIHKDLKLENVMVDMDSPKAPASPGGRKSESARISARSQSSHSVVSLGGSPGPLSPGVKLIDFDTVQDWKPGAPKTRDVLGTHGYIAPEAYGGEYSPASDIYAVGVIMYKLLTRKFPLRKDIFDDKPGESWVGSPAMQRIQDRLKVDKINFARQPLNRNTCAKDLVSRMLAFDPLERPSAEEALRHKWFELGGYL